ncbi:hypothetical protein [Brevundimonas intermedia]
MSRQPADFFNGIDWMPFVILLIAVLLFGYAFNMRKRGVLR